MRYLNSATPNYYSMIYLFFVLVCMILERKLYRSIENQLTTSKDVTSWHVKSCFLTRKQKTSRQENMSGHSSSSNARVWIEYKMWKKIPVLSYKLNIDGLEYYGLLSHFRDNKQGMNVLPWHSDQSIHLQILQNRWVGARLIKYQPLPAGEVC